MECAAEEVRLLYALQVDGKYILPAQVIEPSKVGNTLTVIVQHEKAFADLM